ncbi:hypothetical protein BD560DRAFT_382742 [Blakeslea trispora]|nr:hypothetical protein BD560DRAFT_382742 [Blakeslea trispora]
MIELFIFFSSFILLYIFSFGIMSESILFPPASTTSKLSACPSTKIPQTADWILQDFFSNKLEENDIPSIQFSELLQPGGARPPYMNTFSDDLIASWFEYSNVVAPENDDNNDYFCYTPDLDSTRSSDIGDDAEEELARYIEMFPVVDEPLNLLSAIPAKPHSPKAIQQEQKESVPQNDIDHSNASRPDRVLLTKRKSTSSFSSFKSIMHVFQGNKKSKLNHGLAQPACIREKKTPKSNASHLPSKLFHYFKRHN